MPAAMPTAEEADPAGPAAAPPLLAARLSVLMFLGFAVLGAWLPVYSVYLQGLSFRPDQVAWAYATYSINTLVTPLVWGQIADRWLAAERCISLCSLCVALVLWGLAELTDPGPVIAMNLACWFFMIPALSLSTSLTFRQLTHPERQFGPVRVWGTIGWSSAGLLLTLWLRWIKPRVVAGNVEGDLSDSMRLGAAFALLLAVYAWTLPHTPPLRPDASVPPGQTLRWTRFFDAPVSALRLFRRRSFVVYCGCLFGLYMTMPFTSQMTPLLLQRRGIDPDYLPVCLSLQQSMEVAGLWLLPALLARFGQRRVMLAGLAAWLIGMAIYSLGQPTELVLAGLTTHGLFICCFLVAGQVFANLQATHDIRASAQGFIVLISGSGNFIGSLAVGWVRQLTGDDFRLAYLPAVGLAAALYVVFLFGFARPSPSEAPEPEPLVPGPTVP